MKSIAMIAVRPLADLFRPGLLSTVLGCSFLVSCVGSILHAAPMLIDDFTSGGQMIVGSGTGRVGAPSALGGSRRIGSVGGTSGGTTAVDRLAGQLYHDNPTDNTSVWSVVVDWPGDTPPGERLDLTEAGDRFELDVSQVTGLGSFLSVGVADRTGSFLGFKNIANVSEGRISVPFDQFSMNPGITEIDFSDLGLVRLQVTSPPGSGLKLGSLSVVPEPMAAGGFWLGGIVLWGWRRHRHRSKPLDS